MGRVLPVASQLRAKARTRAQLWVGLSLHGTLFSAHQVVGGAHYKMAASFYEPPPRWGHFSAPVGNDFCVWRGRTEDYSKEKVSASSVYRFDPLLESWSENKPSGPPPPGLYDGSCASTSDHLYLYGGNDGSHYQGSLHQLDTKSWSWKQLSSAGPMRKSNCGMVTNGNMVTLFGGYGGTPGPTQPGAEFIKDSRFTSGWTNELHTFDLKEGEGV